LPALTIILDLRPSTTGSTILKSLNINVWHMLLSIWPPQTFKMADFLYTTSPVSKSVTSTEKGHGEYAVFI
jgi:hypothetical protein